jgi:hypothetical protein
VATKPVSLEDAAGLVDLVRKALESGVGDVRSNEMVYGLLAIAEQWVDEQERARSAELELDVSEGAIPEYVKT